MRRGLVWVAAVVGIAVELVAASLTRPFTVPADVVVAIAIAGLVAALVVQGTVHPVPGVVGRRELRPRTSVERAGGVRWLLWALPVAAVVAWELFCYFSLPRSEHPTLSSMLDALDATAAGRGAAFAGWLALGWYLVTR